MDKQFTCVGCQGIFPIKGRSYANKFCSNQCQGKYRERKWFEDNKEKFEQGLLPSRAAFKKFVKLRDGNQCSVCGQQPIHNGKDLVMILDHIDGDASNNKPLNFRLVCPNCDSQLPTYKGANRGSGRATKGMKWFSSL